MFTGMIGRVKHLAKRETGARRQALSVDLDTDSIDRFKRLKTKLKSVNDPQLIALALKSLEQKTDRIIKRQVRKKAPALLKNGLGVEQIAEYFDKKGVPAPGDAVQWDKQLISNLLDTYGKNPENAGLQRPRKHPSFISHQ